MDAPWVPRDHRAAGEGPMRSWGEDDLIGFGRRGELKIPGVGFYDENKCCGRDKTREGKGGGNIIIALPGWGHARLQ